MQKSLRSLVLVATVVLAAAPAHAGVMGTDPRPHAVKSVSFSQAVLSFFGF